MVQLIEMKSPKTGGVYKVMPSRVEAKLQDGWQLVGKYTGDHAGKVVHALAVHSND